MIRSDSDRRASHRRRNGKANADTATVGIRMNGNSLDQFYTNADAVRECVALAERFIRDAGIPSPGYIEPAAGDGAFLAGLPQGSAPIAIDIAPGAPQIRRMDFLEWYYPGPRRRENLVVIGNPPFGKRGSRAVAFLNHAARQADTVAFILPACFRKYGIQKQIAPDLALQVSKDLDWNEYRLPDGRTQRLNTVFQIWSRHTPYPNLRRTRREPHRHPDFVMRQYNNTTAAEQVFAYDFDFAVPCQGWQDYGRRETHESECERHKQWITIKAIAPDALARMLSIDFAALAVGNGTSVPGFRMNDIVAEYRRLLSGTIGKPGSGNAERPGNLTGTML